MQPVYKSNFRRIIGTLTVFIIMFIVSLFGFYKLNISRTSEIETIIENTVHSYMVNIAERISVDYFQWDDMIEALESNDQDFINTYFDKISVAFPMIKSINFTHQVFDGSFNYQFKTSPNSISILFGIFESSNTRYLNDKVVQVNLDLGYFFENTIHADDINLSLNFIESTSIEGIQVISTESPIQFFHIISALSISMLLVFLLYSIQRLTVNAHYEIEGLANIVMMLSQKDAYTAEHSRDVARYAMIIAQKLNLGNKQMKLLNKAGYLHDIGKIGISETILNKPDKLTPEEYVEIKKHSTIGYEIVSQFPNLKEVAIIVKYHHELIDGSGYPDGLKGDEIPLNAQILSVADIFSALTTDRPYRKGLSREMAFNVMKEMPLNQKLVEILENAST